MSLVVHYWADLQSMHLLRCYGNTRNAWQSPAVIRQAHSTPHAVPRTTHAGEDSPRQLAITSTRLLRAPFHFVRAAGVLQREREMLASTCLYSLYGPVIMRRCSTCSSIQMPSVTIGRNVAMATHS